MTLPASGPITTNQVGNELSISGWGLSLNDSRVRTLAGRPSGAISMADLRGKSSMVVFMTYTVNVDTSDTSPYSYWVPVNVRVVGGTAPYRYYWNDDATYNMASPTDFYNGRSTWAADEIYLVRLADLTQPGNIVMRVVVTDATGTTAVDSKTIFIPRA